MLKNFIKKNAYKLLKDIRSNHKLRLSIIKVTKKIIDLCPMSLRKSFETRWLYNWITLVHQQFIGMSLFETHTFPRVLSREKLITIIVPHYNKFDELPRLFKSIKNQQLKTLNVDDIEIIVVDDGSPNIKPSSFPSDVLVIQLAKHGFGASKCRNLGAKIASGKLLIFVDPDLEMSVNYIQKSYDLYLEWGSRTVISSYINDYFYIGCDDPRAAFGVWESPNRPTNRFFQIAAGALIISRNLFFENHGFDEDLIYGGVEDIYFGYKLSKLPDVQILFSSDIQVKHKPHPSSAAHLNEIDSLRIAAFKDPEYYIDYVFKGER